MNYQSKHEAFTADYYKNCPMDTVALRSAYGDAAHMCDAIAADIVAEGGRGAKAKAEALKRAGDAIWALREKLLTTEPRKAP